MILAVKIVPGSKNQSLEIADNFVKIGLKSQPIEGKANEELIKFLAKKCSLPKTAISIKTGLHSKNKLLNIENMTIEQFYQKLSGNLQ